MRTIDNHKQFKTFAFRLVDRYLRENDALGIENAIRWNVFSSGVRANRIPSMDEALYILRVLGAVQVRNANSPTEGGQEDHFKCCQVYMPKHNPDVVAMLVARRMIGGTA